MISNRKKPKILNLMGSLILVFSGILLYKAPQSANAHIIEIGPQQHLHRSTINLGGDIPILATGLAAPLAAPTPDRARTNEDTPIDINVLSNDGGPTTVTGLITTGTQGSVSINANQTVRYDPTVGLNHLAAGQVFTDTFQYTVISGTLPINTQVSVGVTGVNDNPTPQNDSAATSENTTININASTILINDTDPDGDPLSITGVITSGTIGSASWNASSQTIHYNPGTAFDYLAVGVTTTDIMQYTVSDGQGGSANATVTVTITGVNDNPTPVGDPAATSENTAIDIAASTVLNNDTDPDGDPLSITGVTNSGTKGSASWNAASQTIHYNPGTAFDSLPYNGAGTDTFQYTVCDNHSGCANATVTVSITGVNDNPVAVNDSVNTGENTAADFNVLTNDTDPDTGDTALLTIQSVDTTGGTKGTVSINTGSKSVHYNPGTAFDALAQGQTGTDTFGYTVSDGHGGAATATVTVTITGANDPPTAAADSYNTNEDTAQNYNLLSNDTDPDTGDVLTIQSINTVGTLGTVTIDPGGTSVHYDPVTAFNNLYVGQVAIDTFSYTMKDGHNATSTATVTVTVTGVNDNPTPKNDTATTGENIAFDINASNLLSNDTDPEGDPLSVNGVTASGTKGSVSWNATSQTVHYNPGTVFDSLPYNGAGTDTFQYTVCDNHNGCANATVTVTINGANDNPTPVNDAVSTGENTAANFNVLSNDSDPDTNDTLTISALNNINTKGVVTINAGNNSVHYDPGMAFNSLGRSQTATDSFVYTVIDGHGSSASATVTVTIIGANDLPTANNDTYITPANTKLTIAAPGVLANDSDPDNGDTLTTILVTNPSNGLLSSFPSGGFVYTPTLNYHGLDHFIYHASDGIASSPDVTVTIGVDVTNQPPVVVADTSTTPEDTPVDIHVLANDYDPDGNLNLSTLKVTTSPNHGTTQVNTTTGVITYRPALNYNGDDTFQYEIYDKDSVLPLSGRASVTITITPVNDPPQAADLSVSTLEDTPLPINLYGSVYDVDSNLVLSSLQVITPAGHGTATITAATPGNLIITYTPALNYNGDDLFGYRICDSGLLCALADISLTVEPVNDPPVAMEDHFYSNPISLTVKAPGVLANDFDVDNGDLITATIVQLPKGLFSLNPDGSFTFDPKIEPGKPVFTDTFKYRAYDGEAYSKTATVTITVDTLNPQVGWVEPVPKGGQIYFPGSNELIPIVITATDNLRVARVELVRWDAVNIDWVKIINFTHGPYSTEINSRQLNIGWNQIYVEAYDLAGNMNDFWNPEQGGYIWIYRKQYIFLPLFAYSRSP
jgi:VCBS repeat-containing protein